MERVVLAKCCYIDGHCIYLVEVNKLQRLVFPKGKSYLCAAKFGKTNCIMEEVFALFI